jgi:hypothetical protein
LSDEGLHLMNEIAVKATVKIGGIFAAFDNLRRTDFVQVFRKLRKPARADQRDHKYKMRGPRGPWTPLAASTLARYAREGKRRNRRILAKLPNALQAIVSEKSLKLRSRVRWSLAHQDGPTRVGRGAIIPQRQFLWISRGLVRQARDEFKAALWRRWWSG